MHACTHARTHTHIHIHKTQFERAKIIDLNTLTFFEYVIFMCIHKCLYIKNIHVMYKKHKTGYTIMFEKNKAY